MSNSGITNDKIYKINSVYKAMKEVVIQEDKNYIRLLEKSKYPHKINSRLYKNAQVPQFSKC